MISLGIDQSLRSTGVVVVDGDKKLVDYVVISTDTEKPTEERCEFIAEWVRSMVVTNKVDTAVIEGLSFGSQTNATRDLAKLQGFINSYLKRSLAYGYYPICVAPTSLKKYATGSGKAKKEEMLEACPEDIKKFLETFPKTKGRFDLCDAYWLACYGVDNPQER